MNEEEFFFDYYYANAYLCDRFTLCVCLCHRWTQIVVVCCITDKSCDVLHHFSAAFFIFVKHSSLSKKKISKIFSEIKIRRWTCSWCLTVYALLKWASSNEKYKNKINGAAKQTRGKKISWNSSRVRKGVEIIIFSGVMRIQFFLLLYPSELINFKYK